MSLSWCSYLIFFVVASFYLLCSNCVEIYGVFVCACEVGDLQRVVHVYVRWLQMDARPLLVPPPILAPSPFFPLISSPSSQFFLLSHSLLVLSKVGQTWFSQISASQWVVTPLCNWRRAGFEQQDEDEHSKALCSCLHPHLHQMQNISINTSHVHCKTIWPCSYNCRFSWMEFLWGMGLVV